MPLLPKLPGERREAQHDHDIGHVEYPGVEGANLDENKITDATMPRDAINQVARSARPDQGGADKLKPPQPTTRHEIDQNAAQPRANPEGEQVQPQGFGQRSSLADYGTGILREPRAFP